MGFWLPDSIDNPHSLFLHQFSFFSKRELHILRSRVRLDNPKQSSKKQHIGVDAFQKAVRMVSNTFIKHRLTCR